LPPSTAITPEICRDVAVQVHRAHVPTWLAEDARQEAFVRILAATPRYQAERGSSFRHFSRLQAWGGVRDFLRHEYCESHHCSRHNRTAEPALSIEKLDLLASDPSPEDLAAAGEIPALLDGLPPLWRFVLIERYWRDRTFTDIARECGKHISRVVTIHNQALARLRRHATQLHTNPRPV